MLTPDASRSGSRSLSVQISSGSKHPPGPTRRSSASANSTVTPRAAWTKSPSHSIVRVPNRRSHRFAATQCATGSRRAGAAVDAHWSRSRAVFSAGPRHRAVLVQRQHARVRSRLGDADVRAERRGPRQPHRANPRRARRSPRNAEPHTDPASGISTSRWRGTAVRPRWMKSALAGLCGAVLDRVNTISTSSASGWARSRSAATRLVTPGARPAFISTVPPAPPAIARNARPAAAGIAETLIRAPPRSSTSPLRDQIRVRDGIDDKPG